MKNAIITGATKGMGRAITIALVNEGINVGICARNADELAAFEAELLQINPKIQVAATVADAGDKAELKNFAEFTEKKLGFIDIIVNNVGMYKHVAILDDDDDSLEKQLAVNFIPAYELYRFFGKRMVLAGKGHIFNICSVASINPIYEAGVYSVTKYALLGLNKVMRNEMQQHGVKVTAIIPGSTQTDSWKGMEIDPNQMVQPQDIASALINILKMSMGANVDEIIIKPAGGQL